MTRYALLVRGINVGGKNKVVMAELRQELTNLELEKVESYINSGNIFFTSTDSKSQLIEKMINEGMAEKKIGRASCRERVYVLV